MLYSKPMQVEIKHEYAIVKYLFYQQERTIQPRNGNASLSYEPFKPSNLVRCNGNAPSLQKTYTCIGWWIWRINKPA